MTTTKKITKKCFGGADAHYTEITTDEHKGAKLGQEIRGDDRVVEEPTDHIESEDAETMTFDFGTVRKDRIERLIWLRDEASKTSTVRYVRFAP